VTPVGHRDVILSPESANASQILLENIAISVRKIILASEPAMDVSHVIVVMLRFLPDATPILDNVNALLELEGEYATIAKLDTGSIVLMAALLVIVGKSTRMEQFAIRKPDNVNACQEWSGKIVTHVPGDGYSSTK